MSGLLERALVLIGLLLLTLIVATTAFAFLGASIYFAIAPAHGPAIAALSSGLSLIFVATATVLAGGLIGRARPRTAVGQAAALEPVEIGAFIGKQLSTLSGNHPAATFAGSMAAGFAVGASPRLRRALRDLLSA